MVLPVFACYAPALMASVIFEKGQIVGMSVMVAGTVEIQISQQNDFSVR